MQETSTGVKSDVSYIPIYAVQVRLQVGFQVEQDAVTWKVTCHHLLLALDRKFSAG